MKVTERLRNGAANDEPSIAPGEWRPEPGEGPAHSLDLRSDVVSPPTAEMWEAMRREGFRGTPLNDDGMVRRLEETAAELTGKEAALFVPTCTVANILALMTLGERGTQVVLEKYSHIAASEEWGLAYICGLVPHLLENREGAISLSQLQSTVSQAHSSQKVRTCLLCLENSHTNAGGITLDMPTTRALADVAHDHGAAVHLDGARLFNAALARSVAAKELAAPADTVSLSLNKGLGAPYGALLCGREKTIAAARRNARRIGAATIHKSASLAAAGLVALRNREHLAEDHRRARNLALALAEMEGIAIDLATVQTNLVRAELQDPEMTAVELETRLARRGVAILVRGRKQVRFVLHRNIDDDGVRYVAEAVAAALSGGH